MTTVTVSEGKIVAEGHAGNRDVCVFVEAGFQVAARTMGALGAVGSVIQEAGVPRFTLHYSRAGDSVASGLLSVLTELAGTHPANLSIVDGFPRKNAIAPPSGDRSRFDWTPAVLPFDWTPAYRPD